MKVTKESVDYEFHFNDVLTWDDLKEIENSLYDFDEVLEVYELSPGLIGLGLIGKYDTSKTLNKISGMIEIYLIKKRQNGI